MNITFDFGLIAVSIFYLHFLLSMRKAFSAELVFLVNRCLSHNWVIVFDSSLDSQVLIDRIIHYGKGYQKTFF